MKYFGADSVLKSKKALLNERGLFRMNELGLEKQEN
jgi:hypothetical protein